ncbi:MAG: hypothetical protein QM831_12590 [Kofleriaceae bacterium]
MNTHQQLERTLAVQHDGRAHTDDEFCIDCLKNDIERNDLRGELALLGILELMRLAELRAAQAGTSTRAEWAGILEPARLVSDLFSINRNIRRAAINARTFVADYLNHRVVLAHPGTTNAVLITCLAVIMRRTRDRLAEIEAEGTALRFLAQIS